MKRAIGSLLWVIVKAWCRLPREGWLNLFNPIFWILGLLALWLDPSGEPKPPPDPY